MIDMRLRTTARHALAGLAIALAVALFAAIVFWPQPARQQFHAQDISGATYADDFQLRDTEGQPRSLADYRGNAVMVFFGFTQCPSACPTELARSAEVMRQLGPDAAHVRMVFITVDPERDSADLLRDYVHAFNPGFIALHGDAAQTAATATRFKAYYQKVPIGDSYTMDHSTFTYIYDPRGRLRLLAKPELDAGALTADLRALLARQD